MPGKSQQRLEFLDRSLLIGEIDHALIEASSRNDLSIQQLVKSLRVRELLGSFAASHVVTTDACDHWI